MVITVYLRIRELCNAEPLHLPRAHSCTQRERQSLDVCRTEGMFGQTGLAGEALMSGTGLQSLSH